MVLEALISPITAEQKPWETFFIGILYASIGITLGLFIFPSHAGMIAVGLTAMASIPLIYGAIRLEEKKDITISEERMLIKEHGRVVLFLACLFMGFTVAFAAWYVLLPADSAATLFSPQLATISGINSMVTGNDFATGSVLLTIILNNLKVLAFCLLFAFFYGFGAILILTWNASVFAVVIGATIRAGLHKSALVVPLALLKYSIHGIPEIVAYFCAGLAGGIISIAVIRHDWNSDKFRHILIDSVDLTVVAIVLLLIAGLLEVFVSPLVLV